MSQPFRVLFVCMGNICRSPTAHGVFRQKVADAGLAEVIEVDSAGTHNFHPGSPPDRRSQAHAAKRGYNFSDLRARQIRGADFEHYDLILVMDAENLAAVGAVCPSLHRGKIRRLTEYCLRYIGSDEVPDPYYGSAQEFERALDLVDVACDVVLQEFLFSS
jgi:protein-tyrosine phosphatase